MEEREINLMDLLRLFAKRWWIIAIVAAICASALGVYSKVTYTEQYTADVTLFVTSNDKNEDQNITQNMYEVNWALKVIKNQMELLQTPAFYKDMAKTYVEKYPELSKKYPYNDKMLANCISYNATEDTYLFDFSVTTADPEVSYALACVFEECAPKKIFNVTEIDSLRIASGAEKPTAPSNGNNIARNVVIGFFVGALLTLVIVFVIDMLDVRIKSEEDLVKSYPYPILGSIPNFDSVKKKKGYRYGRN